MLVYQRVDFLDGENGEMVGGLPTSSVSINFKASCAGGPVFCQRFLYGSRASIISPDSEIIKPEN